MPDELNTTIVFYSVLYISTMYLFGAITNKINMKKNSQNKPVSKESETKGTK